MLIRLAALVVVIATLLISFNSPSKSGTNYTQLADSCLGNKGGMTRVVAACTTLMKGEGGTLENQIQLLRARGWAYYWGKEYDKAVSDYTSALSMQPDDPHSILWRAIAYDVLGEVQAAEADYSKALLLNPDSNYALFKKAKFDRRQGNIHAAILGLEKILEVDPSHKGAGGELPYVYYDRDGIDGAKQFLTKAKQRWPDETWVYSAQFSIDLQITGDHESALEAVSEMARLKPSAFYESWFPAIIHLKIGDEEKGIEYVEEQAARISADNGQKKKLINRWFYNAKEWYLWRNNKERLKRGELYAIMARPDLATAELEIGLQGSGLVGRKSVLDKFGARGVSVTWQAYAGSADHINKAVSEYVTLVGKELNHHLFGPPKSATGE